MNPKPQGPKLTLNFLQHSSLKLTQSSNCARASISSRMKLHTTTTLVLLLLLTSSSLQVSMAGPEFCDGKCKVRCSKASRHDDCLKYCGICCANCNCVPPGTAGNKDECPCYRDMTTGEGKRKRPKCP